MKGRALPALSGFSLLALFLLIGRGAARTSEPHAAGAPVEHHEGGSAAGAGAARDEEAWPPVLRLYEEFFGCEKGTGSGNMKQRIEDIVRAAAADSRPGQAKYALKFLIAVVADPGDARLASNFDLVVRGIEMGLEQTKEHYLFDRRWLPLAATDSSTSGGGEKAGRISLGLMLFRDTPELGKTDAERSLLSVFLVGETPMAGIDKKAFGLAVDLIDELSLEVRRHQGMPLSGGDGEILVLGPSSSGSAESLGIEMAAIPRHRFVIISGSATTPDLEKFMPPNASFARTIIPDNVLADRALKFLHQKLGWDLRYAALLLEEGTTYVNAFENASGILKRVPKIILPSNVQPIRNAWEESQREGKANSAAQGAHLRLSQPGPEVSLADRVTPADRPEISLLTANIEDVALDNLLRRISRFGYRYIGILATDVKDEVFLAGRLHQLVPDVVVFSLQSNLLYSNPHGPASAMFGALAISSSPLIAKETPPFTRLTRQFASEAQEGVFWAVQCLLGERIDLNPAVWVAATGQNTMSPLAYLPVERGLLAPGGYPCPLRNERPQSDLEVPERQERGELPILFFLLLLIGLGVLLVLPPYLSHWRADPSRLLALTATVLMAMEAGVIILIRLPEIEPMGSIPTVPSVATRLLEIGLWPATFFFSVILTASIGLFTEGEKARWRRVLAAAALPGCWALLCPVIERRIIKLWSLEEPGLLYLRLRHVANGLSPLLPLELVGGALLAWLFIELKKSHLQQRYGTRWPLPPADGQALAGCETELQEIKSLCAGIPRTWPCYALLGLVVISTVLPFWKATQPVAEPAGYGRGFLALVVSIFLLSVTSFYRFTRSWRLLRHVLGRLEHCECKGEFQRLAEVVRWNPMRSFAWHIPSFRDQAQVIDLLKRLAQYDDHSWLHAYLQAIEYHWERVFLFEARNQVSEEGMARAALDCIFRQVRRQLARRGPTHKVRTLDGLLIVAYLRNVFAHLRYSLMSAMITALLLLAAVSYYAFVPGHFLLVFFWSAVVLASVVTLVVFVEMDRNVVLSWIGGSTPGRVTLDRALLSNILTYAILPLAALASSQIPEAGETLGRLLEPLARVLETS